MYDRAQLKQSVKQTIAGTRPRPMWLALLYLVITSIGASIISGIVNGVSGMNALSTVYTDLMMNFSYDIEAVLQELILTYANQLIALISTIFAAALLTSVLSALWNGLMTVGFHGYCLSLVRGEKPGVGHIFCGFPLFGKVILTSLLVFVFTALWTCLYALIFAVIAVAGALLLEAIPLVGGLVIFVGYVLFLFLMVRLTLRYSMTNFVLLDTGKYGLEAITASKKMMKGKKGKLFGLYLSFLGWYLLIFAVILVGCLIIGLTAGAGIAGISGGMPNGSMLAGMIGVALFVLILMMAAIYLIEIWLLPYVTGSVAKFYLFFKPQEEPIPALSDSPAEF